MHMGKIFFQITLLVLFMTSCYTVLKHPEVQYSDKLGVKMDSLTLYASNRFTRVEYNDNCSSCHSDYNWVSYFQPNRSSIYENPSTEDNKMEQFHLIPWWSGEVWLLTENDFEKKGRASRRSRRSYNKSNTGGGSLEYIAPPGVVPPTNLKVKSSSSGKVNDNNDPNAATRAKDSPDGNDSDGNGNSTQKDDNGKKKKPQRRR